MATKKPKWARKLNKRDLQHIADAGPTGRPALWILKENANNPLCVECRCIAIKAGVSNK
ncbi:MAG: hypothetical protein ACR652_18545 [Methylocystis sp.]|uniref:hypothetical protein n=1 Tax=Methylocystis sp. TaxID=1911079 RepID=UPI003DA4319D